MGIPEKSKPQRSQPLVLIAIIFLMITILVSWWGLQTIKEKSLQETQDTLSTVLNTTKEALDIWIEDQLTKTVLIAHEKTFLEYANELIHASKKSISADSSELNMLNRFLNKQVQINFNYYLIDLNGINIGSMDIDDLGKTNIIKRFRPIIFDRLIQGEERFVPPIPSDKAIPGVVNIAGTNIPASMFMAVPIKNADGKVLAIFAERFDPASSFTKITALGRIGESGETYAFDENSRLLTSSRFDHKLIEHGFMDSDEGSILAFEIKDPGHKLIEGISISDQHFDKPLTKMAQSATAGLAGYNIAGYRDYRGETVLGAWVWLNHLDIGLTTEIDQQEALAIYTTTRSIILSILIVLILMAGLFTFFIWQANSRVKIHLETSKDKLEKEVNIRTSELIESESKLIIAKELAEQASRSKSEFLASMSHEIRTPINGVIGMLGLLTHSELNNDQERKVAIAQSSARSLLNIINDILDFSKVEAGKIELENIDFNIEVLFEGIVKTMAFSAEEHDIELILDLSFLNHKMVKGDPGRLRQILTNLISNAIKFTPEGSVVIRCSSTHYKESVLVSCRVIDTGIGIPEDRLSHLFESFTQVDSSTTREFGGSGLGLAICKRLVNLMGGDIEIISQVGKGSEFSFSVSLNPSNQIITTLPKVDLNLKNILVIDDSAINREIFTTQLTRWGANVFEASSGADGLKLCEAFIDETLHMIILDMQMPMMDGLQFTRIFRRNRGYDHIKIIMMTSVIHDQTIDELQNLGLNGWFTKPVSSADFHRSILATLAQSNSQSYEFVTSAYLESIAEIEDPASEVVWPSNTRILLVEDNSINQLVAEGILDNIGLTCEIANNGEEAIAMLNNADTDKPYTLILMDCQMPVMDGYSATENIRNGKAGDNYKLTPIIAMTANAMTGDREKCIASGMYDYISKPIDNNLLVKLLKKWLPS